MLKHHILGFWSRRPSFLACLQYAAAAYTLTLMAEATVGIKITLLEDCLYFCLFYMYFRFVVNIERVKCLNHVTSGLPIV